MRGATFSLHTQIEIAIVNQNGKWMSGVDDVVKDTARVIELLMVVLLVDLVRTELPVLHV